MSDTTLFFDVQQKTDKQHILENPDTYIGAVEEMEADMWVLSTGEEETRIVCRPIRYIPGLFKLFDEGIVNCRDHVVRMQTLIARSVEHAMPVTHIDVSIDVASGTITMCNDGNGIDVAKNADDVWIPELVFGHLRTSTNYNVEEKKIVGGKNGFGFKLVLIWSTYGRVETVDHVRGLKYVQEFYDNLNDIRPPTVTKATVKKPYTKITFRPDYARLRIPGLTPDMVALLHKRVYDIAAVTDKQVKVRYNGEVLPAKGFVSYLDLYIGSKQETERVYEEANERWEYAVAMTPQREFVQISFVNGIHTAKGGKHVEYILGQLTRKLVDYIEKKKKCTVSPTVIKEHLMLFVRCDIENPSFDSQTKDYLTTPASKFGSRCEVSDKFVEKVAKMGIMDAACAVAKVKEGLAAKRTDGSKTRTVRGVAKLHDAAWAGTSQSMECTLLLCEGDSAMAAILSGLKMEDKLRMGVYPLKGKIINASAEGKKKLTDNAEVADLKKILGLEANRDYASVEEVAKSLRYGAVRFITDQDLDGSHIKALGLNLFDCVWPKLARIPGFLGCLNTPIIIARRGQEERFFYHMGEYTAWCQALGHESARWTIKYYKGLGTSTAKEFRQYFQSPKWMVFDHTGHDSSNALDLVFNKHRAMDRKGWLQQYQRSLFLDTSQPKITCEEFVHRELIHFSKYDCERSIPNVMDGLKISLRKILFAAFKKGLTKEIKVAQFSGYVSEHTCYHHGEASLNKAIVGMAQTFVGANNLGLLQPNGQFGTRLSGGKDHASERYIFTQLHPLARVLFPEEDDAVLDYLQDDGVQVEPVYYAPILPMVLINGAKGIGTGYSTDIPNYDPRHVLAYLRHLLRGETELAAQCTFVPHYEGFQGTITALGPHKYLVRGVYQVVQEDTIRITELPVGTWTQPYKEWLDTLLDGTVDKDGQRTPALLKDVRNQSTPEQVWIELQFAKGALPPLLHESAEHGCTKLEKVLGLYTTLSTANMHLFDAEEHLQKYETVQDIVSAYYGPRLRLYARRKEWWLDALAKQARTWDNKRRYIEGVLSGEIDLRRKSKAEIAALLEARGFDRQEEQQDYHYLTSMPMDAVSAEKVADLLAKQAQCEEKMRTLSQTSPETLWLDELARFEQAYDRHLASVAASTSSVQVDDEVSQKPKTSRKRKAAHT